MTSGTAPRSRPVPTSPGGGPPGSAPGRARAPRAAGLAALGLLLAAAVRLPLLPHETDDYAFYLSHWYGFIAANGHFAAMQYEFANYNLPYLYLLAGVAWLFPALPTPAAIKGLSLAFEAALAAFVGAAARLRHPRSAHLPVLAGVAVLAAPPVVLNSAMWAQSDSTYTAFLALALFLLLRRRPALAAASFGLALSLKLQAVFLFPVFLWLAAKREIGWRPVILGPAVCLLTLVPAWLLGRPFYDLLLIYVEQADLYRSLSMEAPTLYVWLPEAWFPFWPLGVALCLAVLAGTGALARRSRERVTPDLLVTLAAFSTLVTPYLLPKMFDRYFYPAVVFAIVLAFFRPRFAAAPFVVAFAAISSNLAGRFGLDAALSGRAFSVALFVLLVVLGRRLLHDLGYRAPLVSARSWLAGKARRARRVGAPAVVLSACLAAAFFAADANGVFDRDRPVTDESTLATLARAANLSAEHRFVGFTRRTPGEDGAVRYERDNALPLGANLVWKGVVHHFGEDGGAQAAALRGLAFALVGLAALLAYGGLRRLCGRRIAVGAVLLAFSAVFGAAPGGPSPDGALAVFALCLAFHAAAVFVRERRPLPFLLRGGAAVSLSFGAAALLLPFAALGAVAELRRRGRGRDSSRDRNRDRNREGRAGNGERSPGGARELLPALSGSRFLRVGVVVLLFAGAAFGVNRANEAALRAEGGRFTEAASSAPRVGAAVAEGEAEGPLARLGRNLLPYAPGGRFEPWRDGLAALLAALALVGVLVWAAFSRRRLGLLPLAAAGVLAALFPGLDPAATVGAALVFFASVLLAVRRSLGGRPLRVAVGLATAAFVSTAVLAIPGNGAVSAGEDEDADRTARVREDLREIRRLLLRRAEAPTVLLAAGPFGSGASDDRRRADRLRAGWLLGGNLLVDHEDRRGLAEFVIAGPPDSRADFGAGAEAGPTPLTPGNREVFLYHRAAYDGELGALLEGAGPPRIRAAFAVHLREDALLYVREGCLPEDQEGLFILHLDPADPEDLRPHRRQFGFENLDFRFAWRALDRGDPCVARVALPDWPIRRVVTGQHPGRRDAPWLWRGEFTLSGPSPEASSPGAE